MTTTSTEHCPNCNKPLTVLSIEGFRTFTSCHPCREAAQEADRLEALQREEYRRRTAWIDLCPSAYRLAGHEAGETDEAALKANSSFDAVMKWDGATNLILVGATGCQKTRMAFRILQREHEADRSVLWFSAADFQTSFQAAASDFITASWLREVAGFDILLFDDLLKSRWTENTWSGFFEVVKSRMEDSRPTIFTLNDGPGEIARALSATGSPILESMIAPLIRRMTELATVIQSTAPKLGVIPRPTDLPRATQQKKLHLGQGLSRYQVW